MMYLWLKAFHVIAMVAWFAGLFYLPRLFVYHADAEDDISIKRFKVMEWRLFYAIMTPAAITTIFFGVWLILLNPHYYMSAGWFHAKLGLILLLIGYHIHCGIWLKQFAENRNKHTAKFYRMINEVPTIFLVAIVILVIVKP